MSLFHTLFLINQSHPLNNLQSFLNKGNTQMDWKETRDSHVFEIDLPGFTKEDVKLEVVENRVLCIKAEKKDEEEKEEEKSLTWHCRERSNNNFVLREFRLPENAKIDDVKASMCDGVLIIIVPKDDEAKKKHKHKHKKKKVHISEGGDDEGVEHKGFGRFVCCKV